jgi:Cd2+/Zn2+-exporting ATPase
MIEAAEGFDTDDVIRFAAAAESGSTHPIAAAIIAACEKPVAQSKIRDVRNVAGKGITAMVGRDSVTVGNRGFFEDECIAIPDTAAEVSGTNCYVARNGRYIGTIVVADMPKKGAAEAIKEMLEAGVRSVVMLTGDSETAASYVAEQLGITDYRAELLPQDKVSAVESLLKGLENKGGKNRGRLAFIGDGINDAPVLSVSDVGIAMGSLGSDAAIEAADVVIMDDDLRRIPAVMGIARKTLGISRQNIAFALLVKFSCLVLGAMGIANMWIAVFADVGVAVICILNSMRMLSR